MNNTVPKAAVAAVRDTSANDEYWTSGTSAIQVEDSTQSLVRSFRLMTGSDGTGSSQEDAMEFFTYVCDCLHEEFRHLQLLPSGSSRVGSREQASTASADDDWETVGAQNKSLTSWTASAKVRKVVVDKDSKEQALEAVNASIINNLFHGILR